MIRAACFQQAGHLLVRFQGRLTQMPGPTFGVIRQDVGERPVGTARRSLVVESCTTAERMSGWRKVSRRVPTSI